MNGDLVLSDCTLREGEQQPGIILGVEEKVRIAGLLAELGVRRAEVGTPAVSEGEREAIRAVVDTGAIPETIGVCRAREDDVRMAAECGLWGVVVSSPVSPFQLEAKFGLSVAQMTDMAVRAHTSAKELGLVSFASAYDTTRTARHDLEAIYGALVGQGLVDGLRIVDTVGAATPTQAADLVRWCKDTFGLPVEVHFHDDFGLALANVLAAVTAGADSISSSVGGVGERAGNAATEEVVAMMSFVHDQRLGLRPELLAPNCQEICRIMGLAVQHNRAIIGRNAFRHVSGISISGFVRNPLAAQPVEASVFGATSSVVLGKTSGAQAVQHVAGALQIRLGEDQLHQVTKAIKLEAEASRRLLSTADLLRVLRASGFATDIDHEEAQ